jgi:hypothetical protein
MAKPTRISGAAIALLFILMTPPAIAHSPDAGPNGGQIQEVSGYHLELVTGAGELTIYITGGDDNGVATDGATGSALVLANKQKAKVTLVSGGENRITGQGDFAPADDMKVVVTVKLANGEKLRARFASK